ncbi:transcription factor Adf-1-like [Dermacentor albipictus]|uniref:transcription factor Adf-1-like n=1 Tax=Dermacentor albipictus TaxID=60249 RepID=UPI0038FCAD64
MDTINNEALIVCVEARPALWQAKHKHHKNKHMTRCLWSEVSKIVMPDVAVTDEIITALQKRWKSLRDKFRRVLKTLQEKKKSGAGADDVQDDVAWPFFDQMMFLRDTMEYRPTSGNVPPVPPSNEEENAADILTKVCQVSNLATLQAPPMSGEESQAQAATLSTASESAESQEISELDSPLLEEVLYIPEASEAHHTRPQSQASLASAGSLRQAELGTLGSVASEATTSRRGKRKRGN